MSNKALCKHLLEIILKKKIRDIRYTELQKQLICNTMQKHSPDVYVEDDLTLSIISIQTTDEKIFLKDRGFIRGMIDLNILNKGESYNKLKKKAM